MTPATATEVEEYNSFGPWVVRVGSPEDVPPLFAAHPIDFGAALQVLKFPRPESRRDLLPGMNLYDYVVVVMPTLIEVLRREGERFTAGVFRVDQLASISSGADLLDGWLEMRFTGGESYSIPYNGSASQTITRLVDTIRGLVKRRETRMPAADSSRCRSIWTRSDARMPDSRTPQTNWPATSSRCWCCRRSDDRSSPHRQA